MAGNLVTTWTFRSASGAIGPQDPTGSGPLTPPPANYSYVVAPVIVLASDSVPVLAESALASNMDASMAVVQQYYLSQTGRTWAVFPTVVARHSDTEATHNDDDDYAAFERAFAAATVPLNGRTLLYCVFPWYPQPGSSANRNEWRGDAYAFNEGPAVMSDRVARRLCGEVPDTLVAGPAPGFGATSINVTPGTGLRFSRNADVTFPAKARIYGPSGSAESGYEEVAVSSVSGDTMNVTRAGNPRNIAIGDRVSFWGTGETILSNLQVAYGALGHEMGHAFGLPHPGTDATDPFPDATARIMGPDFRLYPNCIFSAWEKARMFEPQRKPFFVLP